MDEVTKKVLWYCIWILILIIICIWSSHYGGLPKEDTECTTQECKIDTIYENTNKILNDWVDTYVKCD